MSEIIKPLILDETGKAIVEALTQREMTKTRIAEINAAADAAKSGIETKTDEQVARITEVTALAEDVNQLKGDLGKTKIIYTTENKIVNTNKSKGELVDLNVLVSAEDFRCTIIDCNENDVFTINAETTSKSRTWCFVDENNICICTSDSNVYKWQDYILVAPPNSKKLILNDKSKLTSYKGLNKVQESENEITILKNNVNDVYTNVPIVMQEKGMQRSGVLGSVIYNKHCNIEVKAGEKYLISGYGKSFIPLYVLKDTDENVRDYYPLVEDTETKEHKNILLVTRFDGVLTVNQLEGTDIPTVQKFIGYGDFSTLYGKTLKCEGDSVCRGAGQGEKHQVPFGEQIAIRNKMTYSNTAVSGTTIARRNGRTDSILERVINCFENFDYYLLEGGYNDIDQNVSIGQLTIGYDEIYDEYTVIGAMESICKHLVTNYFSTKKLFVLGNRCIRMSNLDDYWNAIISVLEKWGIPYIDLRKESNLMGLNDFILTNYYYDSQNTGKGDGLHPNTLGYKVFWTPKVEARMKEL